MRAILVNGVLWIPVRLDAEDGTIGEGMFICEKDDPEYETWINEAIVMTEEETAEWAKTH